MKIETAKAYCLSRVIEQGIQSIWINQKSYIEFFREVGAPNQPQEHFEYISSEKGEIILAHKESEIYGWIGLIPRNTSYELAGIEVHMNHRNKGIGKELMKCAKEYVIEKGCATIEFGTSPLLSSNALLYLHENRAHYKYSKGIMLDANKNIPWPYVECKIFVNEERISCGSGKIDNPIKWNSESIIEEIENRIRNDKRIFIEMKYLDANAIMNEIKILGVGFLKRYDKAFIKLNEEEYVFKDFIKDSNKYYYVMER
jgi:GNAT superfamily N-acetyltransferase